MILAPRRLFVAALVALAIGLAGAGCQTAAQPGSTPPPPGSLGVPGLTGVVVVIVDDMDDFSCSDTSKYLPKTASYLAVEGTCFENATVASPVCCPSRAALMTGQFPHNDGVVDIHDGPKLTTADTVQAQLRAHGVETGGVGKFLNGVSMPTLADPQFDSGFTVAHLWKPRRYYDYDLATADGRVYTPHDGVHTTVRTGGFMTDFVGHALDNDQTFYSYDAFMAPHDQRRTPGHRDKWPIATPAHRHDPVPAFGFHPEADTSDKLPSFQHGVHPAAYYRHWEAARVRALYDVDDQMARLFALLRERGALDTTAVFFTSDNGMELGRNGWSYKGTPYAASLDVPLLAYLPGTFAAGQVDTRPVNLIDLTATVYELYGVAPPDTLDGHSLLSGHTRSWEFWELGHSYDGDFNEHVAHIPSWAEVAHGGQSYIAFFDDTGRLLREEFYADPGDEDNLLAREFAARRPSEATLQLFRGQLRAAMACSGTTETEAVDPCP